MPQGTNILKMMRKKFAQIINRYTPKSQFVRNVLTLLSGTTIAQVIPILLSPILTRLYSPQDFGLLGLFLSIIAVLGILGTGKYELAILLPEKEHEAINVTRVSLYLVTVFTVISLAVFVPFNDSIASYFGNEELASYLPLLPLGIAIVGCFNTFNYWAIRKNIFGSMAAGKILRSSTNPTFSIGLGILKAGPVGLILGTIVGQLTETFYLGLKFFKDNSFFDNSDSFKQIKRVIIKYKKFPRYSLGSALLNTASLQLPVLILSKYFDSGTAGLFFHAHKVLSLPMSMIGSSMGQVFFQQASKKSNDEIFISHFTYKTFKKLLFIGVAPLSIILVFGDIIFAFTFGSEWRISGQMAQLLSPWLLMVFIFSPISTLTFVFERQEIALVLNIIIIIIRFSTLYFGALYFEEIEFVVGIFGIASFIIWLCFGIYLLNLAKVSIKKAFIVMLLTALPIVGLLALLRYLLV